MRRTRRERNVGVCFIGFPIRRHGRTGFAFLHFCQASATSRFRRCFVTAMLRLYHTPVPLSCRHFVRQARERWRPAGDVLFTYRNKFRTCCWPKDSVALPSEQATLLNAIYETNGTRSGCVSMSFAGKAAITSLSNQSDANRTNSARRKSDGLNRPPVPVFSCSHF